MQVASNNVPLKLPTLNEAALLPQNVRGRHQNWISRKMAFLECFKNGNMGHGIQQRDLLAAFAAPSGFCQWATVE
jgi:hypothetical protein